MRRKKEAVLCFESNDDGLPKIVRQYRARYRAISQVLDDNPGILAAVHRDILKLSEGDSQGREGDYTSENILRALIVPGCCPHRLHDRKVKRLYLYVTRYMPSKSESRQRKVKASFRTLIERTDWIVAVAEEFCTIQAGSQGHSALAAVALELRAYLPAMKTIVANARRTQVDGETVPASERVFSLFEQHTELIKRGRRQKPVEFGHKVLLCESAEKFITDYEVYEKQEADCELTESVIKRHEKLFGQRPEVLAADKGFCPAEAKFKELAEQVDTLAIPRRMRDFVDKVLAHWQAFRAGIEGTISGLKRAFRLIRCFFRGFRSFSSAVGLGVFCHNLIVLAEHESG